MVAVRGSGSSEEASVMNGGKGVNNNGRGCEWVL